MKSTIRTILYAVFFAVLAVSCQKEINGVEPETNTKETIKISINGLMGEYTQVDGTKADLVNTVRVSWKGGETVYVYDGTHCLGSLAASLDENGDDRYALLSTDTDHTVSAPADGTTKLTLVYSPLLTEAPAVSEGAISISLASQSGAKAPFVAYATLDYTGTTITDALAPFKFATSVIRVNCTGLTVNTAIDNATLSNVNTKCKLTLSGTSAPTVVGSTNGTITRTGDEYFADTKVNTEGEAVFQIAVPALESASEARVLTVAQGSDKVKDRRFATNSLNPATSVNTVCQLVGPPAGALPGEFTVGKGPDEIAGTDDDIKVHFSKGNLVATIDATGAPTAWKFATNQYDCIGEGGANKTIGSKAGDVDFFGWSTSNNGGTSTTDNYGIKTSTSSSDYSGDFYDWGKAYCEKNSITPDNTWRTLSTAEWTYLFNTRTMTNDKKRYSNAVNGVTIGGTTYKGVFIYPDNYNDDEVSSSMTWDQINAAGIVFLPAASERIGSDVSFVGDYGYYWSSSTTLDSSSAYRVFFLSWTVNPGNFDFRYYGYSVRLITESY